MVLKIHILASSSKSSQDNLLCSLKAHPLFPVSYPLSHLPLAIPACLAFSSRKV